MPTEPQPVTMAEAMRRAVEVCDDGQATEALNDYLLRFEDDDEPISAVRDVQERLDEVLGPPELDEYEPQLIMARAVVTYLRYRRDEIDAPDVELLRLAARAEFDGHPPDDVARWLAERGVTE
jgi:hypothetical protein